MTRSGPLLTEAVEENRALALQTTQAETVRLPRKPVLFLAQRTVVDDTGFA